MTAPITSNTLGVNVFTAPGKVMVGERPKPFGEALGFDRSPTIAFPGAVKTFTLSVFDATGAVARVLSFGPFVPSIWYSFRCQSE